MPVPESPYLAEDRYQLAMEAAGFGIIDNNIEEGVLYCSAFCYELFGLQRQEPVTLEKLLARMHPDDAAKTLRKIEGCMDPDIREPYDNEYRIIDAGTGTVLHWVKARGKVYFNELRKPARFIVTVQDISQEMRTRSTRQKLLTLVENSIELMSVLELDGKNSYLNKAGMEMLGFDSFQQVLDTPISALHEPEDIAFVEANVLPGVMQLGRWSGPMKVRHIKTGEVFWVYNNTIRIDDPVTGEPLAIGAVMRDMRPELEAQRALAESKRELEVRVAERTAELLHKNRELEEYTYVTSHDLQEPLRKIHLFTDLIREQEFDKISPLSRLRFDKVTTAVDRMSHALRDLLHFSRLSHEEKLAVVDLNEILRQACTDLELLIAEREAQLDVVQLPRINAVAHQVHQLFYNLLSNALKFVDPERLLQISLSVGGQPPGTDSKDLYWICFSDNGIGFSPENSEKIFGLFQRLHARHEYPGSGIGLALCRKVMEQHGGQIQAYSAPGAGARFYIGFPQTCLIS
jgi:PAS domain S-box-containing protein